MRFPILAVLAAGAAAAPAESPTSSPNVTVPNINLVFDVVFLIDVSQSAANTYGVLSTFASNLMVSYSFSSKYAQAAIIPVNGGGSPMTLAVAYLSTITSWTVFGRYLDNTQKNFADFDDYGQSLQHALDVATSPSFLSAGYRPDQPNHLIVYVTSTSAFSDKPSTASILSQNKYGVITVAYGPGITKWDSKPLQDIAGGAACYFPASTVEDLNGKVTDAVQNLIYKASFNGGKYCGN